MNAILDSKSPRKSRSNTRPLGTVRITNSGTKLPPLVTRNIDGITGAAMNVPPPKAAVPPPILVDRSPPHIDRAALAERPSPVEKPPHPAKRKDSREKSPPKASSADTTRLKALIEDLKQQLSKTKEAAVIQEKELKLEILSLQKMVDEVKVQVWDKDKMIEQLKEQFLRQEEHYRELYEKECAMHKETKDQLASKEKDMETMREKHVKVEEDLRKQCETIRTKLQTDLDNLKQQMAHEIAVRDDKLAKLKRQMAETLQGNSWERQQQLDELSKELTKAHEEIDMLKMKLRSGKK